uniref:Mitochondrial import inner membrane translocase subunit n=1 Tax=Sinocyclocheilus grahami TaxID=75366 RepID=A0A672PE96_SINGR
QQRDRKTDFKIKVFPPFVLVSEVLTLLLWLVTLHRCVKTRNDRSTTCSESCLQKYLKMTQRISMRFQEYHIQQNEALAAKAGLLGQPR